MIFMNSKGPEILHTATELKNQAAAEIEPSSSSYMNQREIANSIEKEKRRGVIFVQSGRNCQHLTPNFENFLQTFHGRDNF